MQRATKVILFGVIATGTVLAVKKLSSLMTISDSVSFSATSFNVHDITGSEVKFKIGLRIINPTKETIQLQLNAVRLVYNGKILAQSPPDPSAITINPNSTIDRSLMVLATYADIVTSGLITEFLSGKDKLKDKVFSKSTLSIMATVNGVTTTSEQGLSGTGLALSAGPRNIKDGSQYNHLFEYGNTRKRIKSDGEVDDVVNMCIKIVKDHHQEAAKVAKILQGDTLYDTCANLFNFAYNHLQYFKDKPGVEELRTPARSWYDGQVRHYQQGIKTAGIDCDDFSIFCGSVLHNLNIPFQFRITKYNGRSYYQHIYIYVPASQNNQEIIIDPVLDRFDYEKPYSAQKDNFDMSALYQVEGLAGMPIEMLGELPNDADILSGRSLIAGLEGLGSTGEVSDQLLQNIMATRQAIAANPSVMTPYTKDAKSLVLMLDDAIRYWYTPQRDQVLAHLQSRELELEQTGIFKPVVSINGDGEVEYEIGGFFSKIGKALKKGVKAVGSGVKAVAKGATKLTKFAVKTAAPLVKAAIPIAAGLVPGGGVATGLISKFTGGGGSSGGGSGLISKITSGGSSSGGFISKIASSKVGANVMGSKLMANTMKLASNPMVSNGMNMANAIRVVSANPQYPSTPSYAVPTTANMTNLMNQYKPATSQPTSQPVSIVAPKPVVSTPIVSNAVSNDANEANEANETKQASPFNNSYLQQIIPALAPVQNGYEKDLSPAYSPSQAAIPPSVSSFTNNSVMADQSSTGGEQKPGFFQKNKKALMIAGGVVLVATAGVLLLNSKKKKAAPSLPSATGEQRALSGFGTRRKRKKAITKVKSTAKHVKSRTATKTSKPKATKTAAKTPAKAKSSKRTTAKNTSRRVQRVTLH